MNYLVDLVGKSSINELTPVRRQSQDICWYGPKGSSKSLCMTIYAVKKWYNHWKIFANYDIFLPDIPEYGLHAPKKVETIGDIEKIYDVEGRILFIGDDVEKYISSKFKTREEKRNIISLITDFGKVGSGVDFWYSCKSPLETDKSERRVSDCYVKCNCELMFSPSTIEEYDFMKKYLDFYHSILEVHNGRDINAVDRYVEIKNLHAFCELYDTRYRIRDLPAPPLANKGRIGGAKHYTDG